MLKRFVWNKNDIHSIQLTDKWYVIAQLLDNPYVAFFMIEGDDPDFRGLSVNLEASKPFGVCMVLREFFRKCSVGKLNGSIANSAVQIPEIFISQDRGQWGSRSKFSDKDLIYNLVRIDPLLGDKGIMGNEILTYNVDKNDPSILSNYEITGFNSGYELVRRLILSYQNGRWIDPLKEQRLLGVDNYPLKTVDELWRLGVPKY